MTSQIERAAAQLCFAYRGNEMGSLFAMGVNPPDSYPGTTLALVFLRGPHLRTRSIKDSSLFRKHRKTDEMEVVLAVS